MATPNTKNVASAKPAVGGGISYAVSGTALPTTATAVLAAPYKPLGYIGEDGLVPTRDTSVDKVKAWGGDVVAALLTDESSSFQFTLLEIFQQEVNNFVYGSANVTFTAAVPGTSPSKLAILDKGGKPAAGVFVFDMFYGGKKMRIVVAVADSVVTGENPYVDTSVGGYEITVECLKDTSGVRVYRYFENDDQ